MSIELQKDNQNAKNLKVSLLTRIMSKYGNNLDSNFLPIAINHLTVIDKYLEDFFAKGREAFPNRQEYQKFAIAKLFIDKLNLIDFEPDPLVEEYGKCIGKYPPIEAFHLTNELKEIKRMNFCRNVDKGDVLHVRVADESESEYRLIVINKYNERERLLDYSICAYLLKSHHLDKLPSPLKKDDLLRVTVFGRLKIEDNVFSKLLVSLNQSILAVKFKDIHLGLIKQEEINFYPEDLSEYKTFYDYLKAHKSAENHEELTNLSVSLGMDPYKMYSFSEAYDGLSPTYSSTSETKSKKHLLIQKSKELSENAQKLSLETDIYTVLYLLNESIKIYDKNDVAYALRGKTYFCLWIHSKMPNRYMSKAIEDLRIALKINPFNKMAHTELSEIKSISSKM
ncbi:uncharacterized protein CEXT_638701 [Caerostris extrusa]|uniref:Tetratricopeptide repeat protein n=1 Tax=Caerostris extrusa TaxID=172846 RepID=A0AAV4XL98_CAEEX|nr:uncharacterized protein CEXT_638701 [Caerostris extrusa]